MPTERVKRAARTATAPADGQGRWRRHWLPAALVLVALALGLAWIARDPGAPPAPLAPTRASATVGREMLARIDGAPLHAMPMPAAGRRSQLLAHLHMADQTYCRYRDSSKYPYTARPIAEQRDQVTPNAPIATANPMRLDGGGTDPAVQIQSAQSRVYMVSGETVAFSLRAVDGDGKVLPLVITRALAQGLPFKGRRAGAPVALVFADDGAGADPVAGDGAFAAVLAPAQTGLAAFDGTIRTEVRFSVAGRAGAQLFDVIYSPVLPAVWTGQVRDALEDGSLNIYLKADIRQAGRYIVTGRVDDASGKPFALLTFNDLLGTGPKEVRLSMFGKLMRDQAPALPLTLRDVEGYLLKENTDPDRSLMPRLEGAAHVTKTYPLTAFSSAEWQSEERSRYLNAFGKDVAQARTALEKFDPGAALPKSACDAHIGQNY